MVRLVAILLVSSALTLAAHGQFCSQPTPVSAYYYSPAVSYYAAAPELSAPAYYYNPSVSYYTPSFSVPAVSSSYYAPAFAPASVLYQEATSYYAQPAPSCGYGAEFSAPAVVAPVRPVLVPAAPAAAPESAPPSVVNSGARRLDVPRSDRPYSFSVQERRQARSVEPSTASYQVYAAEASADDRRDSRFSLTFWNTTDESLLVKVNGQGYIVLAGNKTTVTSGREYTWKVEGRDVEKGRVPEGDRALTILIQR